VRPPNLKSWIRPWYHLVCLRQPKLAMLRLNINISALSQAEPINIIIKKIRELCVICKDIK
jgi:hypothetical protein